MTSLNVHTLSPDVSVAGQLTAADMAHAAAAGFRSVINNRPDFEGGPDQPAHAEIEAAARAAGLAYVFLPVAGAYQSPQEIERFAELLGELEKPILAFCRSGARSTRLYQAATGG
ncbi:MAG: TIGR01244 family sulfur transferase [Burkholderiaceae bacterium]